MVARQLVLESTTPAAAFLVTSETAYPGWQAWVDGKARAPVMTERSVPRLGRAGGQACDKDAFRSGDSVGASAWLTLAALHAGLALALLVWR